MEIITPSYYDSFRCIASACPDSCCKEWDVDVDENSAAIYRSLPGPLGDQLREVLADRDGGTVMLQAQGRCPMWRQDGLCEIQSQLGEAALCQVCRDFPRLRHDFGDFVELGLELSCPEAARLILTSPAAQPIHQQVPGTEAPEYDVKAMDVLKKSRAEVLNLLQNTNYPLGKALAVMLLYGYDVDAELDFPGCMPDSLQPDRYLAAMGQLTRQGNMADIFTLYQTLEILTPVWRNLLNAGPIVSPWSHHHRALARYLVERYWLQAISDLDLLCRVKFIITSCLMVKSLDGDILENAQLYSKEIENDPDNVESLLEAAYTSSELTDAKLLHLLLAE